MRMGAGPVELTEKYRAPRPTTPSAGDSSASHHQFRNSPCSNAPTLRCWPVAARAGTDVEGEVNGEVKVEVNTASRAQLESLPGLGPTLVQRLLAARPFESWADLIRRVPGVKAAAARRLSAAGLRVAGQPWSAAGGETGGAAAAQ